MSVVVPWLEKCRAVEAELRVVRHEGGRIAADAVIARLDERTRAVVLSSVQWTNGFRLDIQRIGQECRRRDIPFVVDAIQQLGALPLDVEACAIDYLACAGHKWLASPTGLGFVYASPGFAERFRPTLTYAATAVPPRGDWPESWTDPDYDPIQTYALPRTAARFEIGVHHGASGAGGLRRRPRHLRRARPRQDRGPRRWRSATARRPGCARWISRWSPISTAPTAPA